MSAEILIVDDEPSMREMLRDVLGMCGYSVLLAKNGEEAWQACASANVGLVITDLLMPDCDGIELIMRLRRGKPNMPVIAISGGGRIGPTDYLKLAQRCGASRTLMKPFSTESLLTAVRTLLGEDMGTPAAAQAPAPGIGG